jgi:DNA polymerase III delta prime subunit
MTQTNPGVIDLATSIRNLGGQPSQAAKQAMQKLMQGTSTSTSSPTKFWATPDDRKKIALAIAGGYHIYFYGPAGVGKSTMARCLLDSQGTTYYRFQGHEGFTSEDWYGSPRLEGGSIVVQYSEMVQAVEGGFPVIIEELNLIQPTQMGPLFSFLDHTPWIDATVGGVTKRITKRKGFRVFATANDNGSGDELHIYGGGNLLNKALASRFGAFIKVGYLPPAMEIDMIMQMTGLHQKDLLDGLVAVAGETRRLAKDDPTNAEIAISPRILLDWAKAYLVNDEASAGLTHENLAELFLTNRLAVSQQNTVLTLVTNKLARTKLNGLARA